MQAWWISYHDEFRWQYWPNDERLWIVRGFRNYLWPKCMSGKAISRALRGHFLAEAALVNK